MTQYVIRNPNNPIVRDLYKDIPLVDSQGNVVTDSEGRIVCDRYVVQGSVGVSEETVDTKIQNLSSNFVDTTSTQTVGGNKAFSGAVTVPTVATDNNSNHAASTAFVQNVLSTISGSSVDNLVTKNTAQTITAVKTFNSDIVFGATGLRIRRNDTDKYLIFEAGNSSDTSSSIIISGTTRPNNEGVISFTARDSNNNYSSVYLKPDGTFVKDGNKIITQSDLANYVAISGSQIISGVKTFSNAIIGSITGNAATATKATQDSDGNTIKTTYAKLNSPALTGTPTAPTASTNTNNTQIATTAFVKAQGYLTSHQSLDSCVKTSGNQIIAGVKTFSSSPKAHTPDKTTNDTTLATTAYVKSQGYLTSHQSLDSCVKTSGNQTVAGVKTFSSVPICATNPSANNQLANKAYVDSKATSAKATYCTTKPSTTSTASSTKPAVVVTNYRNGNSWYRKWSDGFIEQGSTQAVEDSWITFMVSFSDTNYTLINAGFVMAGVGRQVVSKYKNGFQASSAVVTCGTYAWYACGY